MPTRLSRHSVTRALVDCAMVRAPAELGIRGGVWAGVCWPILKGEGG